MSEASDKKRGRIAPLKGTRKGRGLTEGEKAAILVMRGQRVPIRVCAERFGVTERVVYALMKKTRDKAEGIEGYDYREDLVDRATNATIAGLDCGKDPYKRGNLGATVLRGLGVFQPDGAQVNLMNLINNVPPEFRERYLVTVEEEK